MGHDWLTWGDLLGKDGDDWVERFGWIECVRN